MNRSPDGDLDVAVVGGCGHAGLPLSVAFANAGLSVAAYDIDDRAVGHVNGGQFLYAETGGAQQLASALASGRFRATTDSRVCARANSVIVVIGPSADEDPEMDAHAILDAIAALGPRLHRGQLLVLRSTLAPGTTAAVERLVEPIGVVVAYCPERTAQGQAFTELSSLPQIVASRSASAVQRASTLFRHLTDQIVGATPEEAELVKLFTNAWRYLQFAAANEMFTIANDLGVDFERVRAAASHEYPRADIPSPGFTAGPCLVKDVRQLVATPAREFTLGRVAMRINQGLPAYLVHRVEARRTLSGVTVGILGMAFKAGSDDPRASLAYELRECLQIAGADVLCTDPHVQNDPGLTWLDDVLGRAEVLFIGTPHDEYRSLDFAGRDVVDVWNLLGRGTLT